MQQFDYVLFAYVIALFILGGGAMMIIKKDQKLRRLLDELRQS
jgi:hypothetical protein